MNITYPCEVARCREYLNIRQTKCPSEEVNHLKVSTLMKHHALKEHRSIIKLLV